MMTKSIEATGSEGLIDLADAGYCSGAPLKSCEEKGMEVYVPNAEACEPQGQGRAIWLQ